MTDWFRSWHGAPTDPKWLGIAKKAGVAPGIAVAVGWSLMDRASQAEIRGSIEGYDADGLAYFFGCEPDQVEAIVDAMRAKGMVEDDRLSNWEKRQPRREDDSSQRVKDYRQRKKQEAQRDVTPSNAPETEVDTDTERSSLRSEPRTRSHNGNPIVILQSIVDAMAAQRWVSHCQDKGRRISAAQAEELVATLRQVVAQGGNATEALQIAVRKGWLSIEVEYLRNAGMKFTQSAPVATIDWASRVKAFYDDGIWSVGWGPRPGDPGCDAPTELLTRAAA